MQRLFSYFTLGFLFVGLAFAQEPLTFDPVNPPTQPNAPFDTVYNHYGSTRLGPKNLIVFLVIPSDGNPWTSPPSFETLQSQLQNSSQRYYESSYHRTWFGPIRRNGENYPMLEVTSQVLQLPRTRSEYTASFGTLLNDAAAAAQAIGYDPWKFDRWVVMSNTSMIRSTGLAFLNGRGAWVGNRLDGNVALHEWGHNWGAMHANSYYVPSGEDPNLPARSPLRLSGEYGDGGDVMGGGGPLLFNQVFREQLGFLSRARGEVVDVTASGTYRLYDFEHADRLYEGTHARVLNIPIENYTVFHRVMLAFEHTSGTDGGPSRRDRNRNAVSARSKFSSGSNLLDTTPNSQPFGNERDDSAIKIGRTFSEGPEVNGVQMFGGFHVTPVLRGSEVVNGKTLEWIDVVINYGNDIIDNQPPTASLGATMITGAEPGQPFTVSVTASDPNGDPLAFDWDFGDGGYNFVNSDSQTYTWSQAGLYLLRVTVSDMKGGTATDYAWVNVGEVPFLSDVTRTQPLSGLRYQYYESSHNSLPDFSRLLPVDEGTVETFSIAPRQRDHAFAFTYEGYIHVPDTDVYTFWLHSDDGSRLWIGNSLVVDNDGLKSSALELSGTVALDAGWHPVRLEFFHRDGNQRLDVSWGTLTHPKAPVTAAMLSQEDPSQFVRPEVSLATPADGERFVVNSDILLESTAGAAAGIEAVLYFANGAYLGEASAPPYALVWPKVSVGNFTLVAKALAADGSWQVSESIEIVVESPPPARSIGVNLGAGGADRLLGANERAGAVYAERNWNNMTSTTLENAPLLDAMGLPTSTTVSFNAAGSQSGFHTSNGESETANGRLMRGSIRLGEWINEGGPLNVYFTDVPYLNYDVYVYFDPANSTTHDNSVQEFRLTPGGLPPLPSIFGQNSLSSTNGVGDFPSYDIWTGFREAVATVYNGPESERLGNYVVFRNVNTPDFTVASTVPPHRDRSFRYLTAVQIVESTPTEPAIRILPLTGEWAVSEGGPGLLYEVRLIVAPDADVTVNIDAGDQLAVEPAQLVFTPANGLVPQVVRLTAVNDSVAEGPHTGTLTHQIVSAGNYAGFTVPAIPVAIADNDQPTISVFAVGQPAEQGQVPGTFRVVRGEDPHPGREVIVHFSMSGTVTAGADYSLTGSGLSFNTSTGAGTLTIPAGVAQADITLTPVDDSVEEPLETAIFTVQAQTAYLIGSGVATLTILDNDRIPRYVTHYTGAESAGGLPLSNHRITFTPDGSPGFYAVTVEESSGLPVPVAGHTNLKTQTPTGGDMMNHGTAWWRFNENFTFFGQSRNRLVISMNGNITFENAGDTSYTFDNAVFFSKARIGLAAVGLDPHGGGDIYYAKLADRYVVTFLGVDYWRNVGRKVNVQAELFFNGTIVLTYGQVDQTTNWFYLGLSPGGGVPSGFTRFDFLALKETSSNAAPIFLSAPPPALGTQGQTYSHLLQGFDADEDALSFSASGLPAGLSLTDHGNGTATLSGSPSVSGTFAVTLSLSDGSSAVEQAFTLTVLPATPNAAPVFTSSPVTNTFWGEEYSYTVTAADADGQPLTFSAANIPGWLTLTPAGSGMATLSGITPITNLSQVPVILRVSDGIDTTEQFFILHIDAPAAITRIRPLGHAVHLANTEHELHLETEVDGNGQPFTLAWSQIAGPGTADLDDPSAAVTRVRFDAPGYYELELAADNGRGVSRELFRVLVETSPETLAGDGLIGHWRLNESDSPFLDSSGQENHAETVTGTIQTGVEGVEGTAIAIPGESGNGLMAMVGQPTQMTIAAWIFPTQMPATGERTVVAFQEAGGNPGARLTTNDGSSRMHFRSNHRLRGVWRIERDVNAYEWTHIVVRYDDSSVNNAPEAFINGVSVPVTYISGDPAQDRRGNTDRMHIGNGTTNWRSWRGSLDEIKLYDRLVGDDEIHWLMNPLPINRAPELTVANLGTGPNTTFTLEAELSDDGLPDPPAEVTTIWTLEDGPGGGVLGSPSNLDSTFTSGPMSGTYTLRLTADDGGAKVSMTALIQSEGGEPRAPTITGHPQSQTVPHGGTATFSVSFDAEPYPGFAWYKDRVLLPEASGPILTLNSVTVADAGSYHVVLSNLVDGEPQSATSNAAVLNVILPPVITTQPQSQTAQVGGSVSFTVSASGEGDLSYQWYKDGAPLDGEDAASLILTDIAYADAGEYHIAVTNPAGTTSSDAATLAVEGPVQILTHPAPQTVSVGSPVSFSVTVAGTPPFTYQWFGPNGLISGADGATLTIPQTAAGDAGSYYVVVGNAFGSEESQSALLSLLFPPAAPVLSATALSHSQIELSWSGAADSFEIQVATAPGGPWEPLATVAAGPYTHSGLTPLSTRHYRVRGINSHGTGPWSAVASATSLEKLEESFLISFGDTNYTEDPAGRTWQSFRLRQTAGTDSPKLEHTDILLVNTDGDDSGGIRFSATSDVSTNMGFQGADVVLESFFGENPFDWFTPSEGAQREVPAFNQNGRYWDYTLDGFDPTDEVTVEMVIRRPGSGRPIDLIFNPGEADEEPLLSNADSAATQYVTHTVTGAESYTFRLISRTNNNWVGTLNAMSVTVEAAAPPPPPDPLAEWIAQHAGDLPENATGETEIEQGGVMMRVRDIWIAGLTPGVDERFEILELDANGLPVYDAKSGRGYRIWWTDDLTNPESWEIYKDFAQSTPTSAPGNGRVFYRLEVRVGP